MINSPLSLSVFLLVSAGFVAFSWRSLRDPRSHGFYRFFAFETILFLVLLNRHAWFRDPFSPMQIASWIFLAASLFIALYGFYLLRKLGKPEGAVENTTELVTQGLYRYIRHPLYSSILWFGLGAFLKDPSLHGLALFTGLAAFLIATARAEEGEMLKRFGEAYQAYMHTTKMFIPFVF